MSWRVVGRVREGGCGAVFVQETLFDTFVRICTRSPHPYPDRTHHDGSGTWHNMPGERYLMTYTCNNIHKDKGRTFFCELQLSHDGDHRDGETTWGQAVLDDDLPPLW